MTKLFSMNTISKKLLMILMGVSFASIITVTFVFSAYELTTAQSRKTQGCRESSSLANQLFLATELTHVEVVVEAVLL